VGQRLWTRAPFMIRKIEKARPGELRYEARGRDGGKYGSQYRRRFRTRKEAEAFELNVKVRHIQRKSGLSPEPEVITYERLVSVFLAQYDARSKPWKAEMLAYSTKGFGSRLLGDLRPDQISTWLSALPLAPKTRKHILDSMRQVLTAGVEWGYLAANPARASAVRGPSQVKPDVRPFRSWDEIELLAACAGRYRPLIIFACATGLRPEEWIALRWEDIDMPNRLLSVNKVSVGGVIYTDQGKSESAFRTVALPQRAIDALAALARPIQSERVVFPAARGGLIDLDNWRARVWGKALVSAGLDPRPLYQMRHTYASLALAAGADIYWVSRQMGHKDIRVTLKHYARFQPHSAVDVRNLGLLNDFDAAGGEGVSEVRH
jgi:integrase